ncbi:MAG TPA: vanadium-dependent haloperoxidase [Saprospiraceae bacterium]|nr:vanadium-dependent haloperoxidase [Saprospiraceae bacterium]
MYKAVLSLIFSVCAIFPGIAQSFLADIDRYKTWLDYSNVHVIPEIEWEFDCDQENILFRNWGAKDESEIQRIIQFWNTGAPGYRWHQIITQLGDEFPGLRNGGRMVNLHAAIYDATVWAARLLAGQNEWSFTDCLNEHFQLVKIRCHRNPGICLRSVAAGAAAEIIGFYFPVAKEQMDSLAEEAAKSRVYAGVQSPTETRNGLCTGRFVAAYFTERAKNDNTFSLWEGMVPDEPGKWTGDPGKKDPMKGKWKPFVLQSNDQFRPGPPPDFEEDMDELRNFNRNHSISDIAWIWKAVPVWDLLVDQMVFEYRLIDDPLRSALVYSAFHIGRYEATLSAWEAKYHYWAIRPFQYDPDFKPILRETPNFPGYPAGHTAVAGSLAVILSHFFPEERSLFLQKAMECSESRFEGGVHFRTDNETGLDMGYKIGALVIDFISKYGQ